MKIDFTERITPDYIEKLEDNEVFVFGSNLPGLHIGGSANVAHNRWGAVWGEGVGHHGQTYAIPTMQQGGLATIIPYVNDFINYAQEHPELTFLVTEIGCGISGFEPCDIAPLFKEAMHLPNIHLPKRFWKTFKKRSNSKSLVQ